MATDCPTLIGKTLCDHIPSANPDPSGPVGSPSAVQVNGKVYMAYVAGNADYERGKINWAVGTGTSLSIYPSASNPVSLVTPMQNGKGACDPHGLGQVRLAYENGYFYFILFYRHHTNPAGGGGPLSTLAYRISYDPANPWGLGAIRQMFIGGQWVAHDGNLVFSYDSPGGLPIYGNYDARGLQFAGQGDVKWDPARLRWIHIFSPSGNAQVLWQESASLESGSWSVPVEVDLSKVRAKYPSTPFVGAAIWLRRSHRGQYQQPALVGLSPHTRWGGLPVRRVRRLKCGDGHTRLLLTSWPLGLDQTAITIIVRRLCLKQRTN